MSRVAIVGSRDYPDLEAVRDFVRRLPVGTIVVSGGAPGVDWAAEREARACGLEVEVLTADWKNLGRAAGLIRNTSIVGVSDRIVAFWDGKSRGTLDTIRKAQLLNKLCTVKQPGQAWRAVSGGEVPHA